MLFAAEKNMRSWAVEGGRVRWDYDTNDHLLDEMLNDKYFASCIALKAGDLIWLTDAEQASVVLRVDFVDRPSRRVAVSVLERQVFTPVTKQLVEDRYGQVKVIDDGYAIQNLGQRGGQWAIVKDREVVEKDFGSFQEAERALEVLRAKAAGEKPKQTQNPQKQNQPQNRSPHQGRQGQPPRQAAQ